LTEDDLKKIVEIQLRRLTKRLEQKKITLELSDSAKGLLPRGGYDPVYGARPLRRTIQKEILDPLSIDILEGKVREGQTVHVDAKNGALECREKVIAGAGLTRRVRMRESACGSHASKSC